MGIVRHFQVELLQKGLTKKCRNTITAVILIFTIVGTLVSLSAASSKQYVQKNLAADVGGVALSVDSNLVNPWGLVQSPSGRWWIADKGKVKVIYDPT